MKDLILKYSGREVLYRCLSEQFINLNKTALEFSGHNITANSISPGKMYEEEMLTLEQKVQKLRSVPLGRFIPPADVAQLALFLASDHGRNITGQEFIIDGGTSILGEEPS